MACPTCGGEGGDSQSTPKVVCEDCDERAVNADGERPWHGWPPGAAPDTEDGVIASPPDRGENPVFVDGQTCWRRYRFGGWVTMVDEVRIYDRALSESEIEAPASMGGG